MKKITFILGALLTIPSLIIAQEPTPNVYFKFDQANTSGTETYSEGASPITATFTPNGANPITAGIVSDPIRGNVFQLVDQKNFLEIASLPINNTDWSMSFWYKWNGAGNGMILKFEEASGNALFFQRNQGWATNTGFYPTEFSDSEPGSPLYITGFDDGRVYIKPYFVVDEWNHLVFTFDTVNDKITAYLNGAFYVETNEIMDGNLIDKVYQTFRLGNTFGQSSGGRYDDFKVYTKVLSSEEAIADYNGTKVLSVKDNAILNSQIKLYSSKNNFKLITTEDIKIAKVEVFNILGQSVDLKNPDKMLFDTSNLTSGLYIVKIRDDEGRFISKRYLKN
ncbi:LamG-like jellyroll fold domain-containing protein [Aestuariibaculum suncheonense]|uniref:T9SS type A sorting domain-containing protein n=1 Tax=Aestuariibaculum suncheonense TaxID=1028745 RepID=A0A8J6Q495_9FLAO|nr:LamG-like jellyroll fold domain-containing protein [Aestuariibaculum suncheonense]MBD0834788.1 T9SS type A sorting domain-containing protein [Aestuariibaculum suncheonense]